MDMSYFNYCQGLTMTSKKFERLFDGPPRPAEAPLTQREMDIAASIQQVTEDIMLRSARHVHKMTGMKNLCMAGGVALNCVGNGRIRREAPFENIWIQPAAGDAGGALGVALFIWYQLLEQPRAAARRDHQLGSLLGPRYSERDVKSFLDRIGAKYRQFDDDDEMCDQVADLVANQNVVGWMNGRMEFGPRALGARSILGDARNPGMQSLMNQKIKFRESFRPFAPAVLEDRVDEYFEMCPHEQSPYMLLVAPLHESKRLKINVQDEGLFGIDTLNVPRSQIPAVTHVDYSARVQTVDEQRHGRYHKLIKHFERKTGCAVIINTSFNVRSEPIVCSPQDAFKCFMATQMDALVIERFLLLKSEQPASVNVDGRAYLSKFQLD
jgi:carbamoyltransferase